MVGQWRTASLIGLLRILAPSAMVVGMISVALSQPVEPTVTPQASEIPVVADDRTRALYRVRRFASLRAEPHFDVQPHGSLSPGEQVLVTGKISDPLWCQVDPATAFVAS